MMTDKVSLSPEQFTNIQVAVAAIAPTVSIFNMMRVIEDDGSDLVLVEAVDLSTRQPINFTVDINLEVKVS